MRIFYQHEPAAFGDCMPYYRDGLYYLYHQRDPFLDRPLTEPFGWSLATTRDFVEYKDHGEVIHGAGDDAQDQFIYAGSVYTGPDGRFHALYTGYNKYFDAQNKPSQVLMRAVSDDGVTWCKEGRFEIAPQEGYDTDDWRDPVVVFDPDAQRWMLIVGGRLAGPKMRRTGRVVWFSSPDAENWTFEGDLYAPGKYTMQEMPDLFQLGERWYLVWTEYSDRSKTVYATGPTAVGPWTAPLDDAFDGRAYYAARTASDGERRFLFGWVANKKDQKDAESFVWAGTLVVHEIAQRPDGTLGVIPPKETMESVMAQRVAVDGFALNAAAGREVRTLDTAVGTSFGMECQVSVEPGTRKFSVLFGGNSDVDEWYAFTIDLAEERLSFDRSPNFPWNRYDNKGLERPLPHRMDLGSISVRLIVDETVAVIYVNDIALSARLYEPAGSAIGFDVVDGQIAVEALAVSRVDVPLSSEY